MKVFIPTIIHAINDEIVSFPKIFRDVAVFFRGQSTGLAAANRAHENIEARFPRLEKGNRLTVWGKIVAAADRIAEKVAYWNLRRDFRDRRRPRGLGGKKTTGEK